MRTIDHLVRDLKITRGARFIAEKRLEQMDGNTFLLINFSSAFIIVFTILPKFLNLTPPVANVVDAIVVSLSILLLAVLAVQARNEYAIRARQMRWCALELTDLFKEARRLAELPDPPEEAIDDLLRRRTLIMAKYDINHDDIDFKQYKADHPWEFEELKGKRNYLLRLSLCVRRIVRRCGPWVVIAIYLLAFAFLVWTYGLSALVAADL